MRKLKVNSKLAVRKVSRLDNIDKTGIINWSFVHFTIMSYDNG